MAKHKTLVKSKYGDKIYAMAGYGVIASGDLFDEAANLLRYFELVRHEMGGSKDAYGTAYVNTSGILEKIDLMKVLLGRAEVEARVIMGQLKAWEAEAEKRSDK